MLHLRDRAPEEFTHQMCLMADRYSQAIHDHRDEGHTP